MQCFGLTEFDTGWISVTQVAFHGFSSFGVDSGTSEWAVNRAEAASNAGVRIDDDCSSLLVTTYGFDRADGFADGGFAMETHDGQIES